MASFNHLPVELWRHIVGYVVHLLLLTPTAIHELDPDKANTHSPGFARWDLFHTAHSCRAAYTAALPYLYGNLSLLFRSGPGPGECKTPQLLAPRTFDEVSQVMDTNYLHYRHFLFKEAAILPRICPCRVCDVQNERGDRVAEITEFKHLAPYYVVQGGRLFLASLLSKEREGATEEEIAGVLRRMWGPLPDGDDPDVQVKILKESNLILVSYPLHIVTSIAINLLDSELSLEATLPSPYSTALCAWPAATLAFLFNLPSPQIKSLTFLTRSANSVPDLCQPLLDKYTFIEYVEVVAQDADEGTKYQQPILGSRVSHFSLMLRAGCNNWSSIPQRLLTWGNSRMESSPPSSSLDALLRPPTYTANHRPMRHLAVRGHNRFHLEDAWEHAFEHHSLESLVLDFDLDGQSTHPLPRMAHSRLRELTVRASILSCLMHQATIGEDPKPILPLLDKLTIVPDMGFFAEGSPVGFAPYTITPFPIKRLVGLKRLHVPAIFKSQRVMWTVDQDFMLALFHGNQLCELHVPLMLPMFNPPLRALPTPNALLTTLTINGLALGMFSNVDLPSLTTLAVDTLPLFSPVPHRWRTQIQTLTVDFVHDAAIVTWSDWWSHAARDLPALTSLTVRKLAHTHVYNLSLYESIAFPELRSLKLVAGMTHVDVSGLNAPGLESLHLDVDHVGGFADVLAKATRTGIKHFKLAGIQCPTMLETLLLPRPLLAPEVLFKIAPVAEEVIAMGQGSVMLCECGGRERKQRRAREDGESDQDDEVDVEEHQMEHRLVCQRKEMTLKYDPQTNGYMWRVLERDRRTGIAMTVVREKCDSLAELMSEEAYAKLSPSLLKQVNVIVPLDMDEAEVRTVVRVVANVVWEHGGVHAKVYSHGPREKGGEEGGEQEAAKETGPAMLVKEMEKIGVEVFASAGWKGEWEGGEVSAGVCMLLESESDKDGEEKGGKVAPVRAALDDES